MKRKKSPEKNPKQGHSEKPTQLADSPESQMKPHTEGGKGAQLKNRSPARRGRANAVPSTMSRVDLDPQSSTKKEDHHHEEEEEPEEEPKERGASPQ